MIPRLPSAIATGLLLVACQPAASPAPEQAAPAQQSPAPAPATPPAQSPAPAPTAFTVQVHSNLPWQPSGVTVQAGDALQLEAQGEYTFHAAGYRTDADGIADAEAFSGAWPVPELTGLALIGRIGPDGPPFQVGSSSEVLADRDGELQFMVNDDILDENEGILTVSIRVQAPGSDTSAPNGAGTPEASPSAPSPAQPEAANAPGAGAGSPVLKLPELGLRLPLPAGWRPGGFSGESVLASYVAGDSLYPNLNVTLEPTTSDPEAAADAWLALLSGLRVHRRETLILSGTPALLLDASWSGPLGPLRSAKLFVPRSGKLLVVSFVDRQAEGSEQRAAEFLEYLEAVELEPDTGSS